MQVGFVLFSKSNDEHEVMNKVSEIIKYVTELGFKIDCMASVSEEKQMRIQMTMESMQMEYQILSNVLNKLKDAQEAIIKNMK